ncbi:ADP-ribosyl cyclase/cyclic ADP-ribose hydrolase 1 [Dromiciops gliroides]|uniref:ADP-ribosyl cyclase/cyclic ADP-ribose hydrolase 1 n=1 Tax=Dromiciops gliroides TaxID=33562 RepID=UPI001CC71515|nr:ADP-ribosyl cyclase/cyclic ADP-ribose hydrolase 1 [Dromiciops gliroides]XP_043826893.1 ADP-ribosyl cyclase/cyclic ADP-ribose hydrolase 1 [Dromiciops gliroides]
MVRESSSHWRQKCRCLLLGLIITLILGAVAVFVAVVFVHKRDSPSELPQWKGRGSTANLKEIMLGRCFNYARIRNPNLRIDCLKIWETFKNAFISKNPCNITEQDYQPLMELTTYPIPCNKTLLWSKTNELAHQYTKVQGNLLTLEDMLPGYMADKLIWCGIPSRPEINYQSCPQWHECANNSYRTFWKTASKRFAEAACGVVHVMLNGSISQAFENSSIFASLEVHHLNPKKVHLMKIWVIHNIGGEPSDSCSGSSIKKLKSIIEGKNITFSCEDDPRAVQFLQCVRNPEEPVCRVCRTEQ